MRKYSNKYKLMISTANAFLRTRARAAMSLLYRQVFGDFSSSTRELVTGSEIVSSVYRHTGKSGESREKRYESGKYISRNHGILKPPDTLAELV